VDDQTQRFLYVVLGVASTAMFIDALADSFQVSNQFWGFLVAIVGLVATVSARRNGKNGGS